MPKLPIDWEFEGQKPFLDFGVGSEFTSSLPSAQTLSAGNVDELFGIPPVEYAAMTFDNVANLSVRSIFEVANNWGLEGFRLGGIGNYAADLMDLGRLSAGPRMEAAAESVVINSLDMAFSAVGAIPVYGWAAEGVWELGKLLYGAVKSQNLEGRIPVSALAYDAQLDTDYVRLRMLPKIRTNDWTKIFLPPIVPEAFTSREITWGNDADGLPLEGFAIYPTGGDDVDGLGVVPGLPLIYGNTQLPRYYDKLSERPLGWGQLPPFCAVEYYTATKHSAVLCKNVGSFIPSAQQLGFQLWSMLRKNSANAFKIDHIAILDAWRQYFIALIAYIEDSGSHAASDPNTNAFQRSQAAATFATGAWCDRNASVCGVSSRFGEIPDLTAQYLEDIQGAGVWFQARAGHNMSVARGHKVPGAWNASVFALVDLFLRDALEACYHRFLKTLTVAYIDETFPALANNPLMRARWQENREKLLTHPARFQVELSMIPTNDGGVYRSRMQTAQILGGTHLTLDATSSEPIEPIDDIAEEPKYPRPPSAPRPAAPSMLRQAALIGAAGLAIWKGPALVRAVSKVGKR